MRESDIDMVGAIGEVAPASSCAADEHAPANVQLGQAFVARVIASVMNSSTWPHQRCSWRTTSTAVFSTT
ncbi:MAG TPA: hypothetical protein VER96_31725 [Polyangiaceae bacterium]|nr:hypothetical protein [Polyangiaceae bacterium]